MSTRDETHSSRLHGAASVPVDKVFQPVLDRLADPEVTPEERAEVAGMLAREAFAALGRDADFEAVGRRFIAANSCQVPGSSTVINSSGSSAARHREGGEGCALVTRCCRGRPKSLVS